MNFSYTGSKIVGLDEVGRGCLFGPVFAGAVVLSEENARLLVSEGLTDSKKASKFLRLKLCTLIKKLSIFWSIGQSSAREIDQFGIRYATELAMIRALDKSSFSPEKVLVVGNLPIRKWIGPQSTLINGDNLSPAIAAASIIAKESRDSLLRRLECSFPGYGLSKNVGYGTFQHRQAILSLGTTKLHRFTFLRRILN